MSSSSDLAPRTAVITGGGTGIGRAIARQLAGDGYTVIVVGRRSGPVRQVAEELGGIAVKADLSDPDDVERAASTISGAVEVVDALVLNAGGADRGPVTSVHEVAAHWQRVIEQNIFTAVLFEHAMRPHLRRPGGRIVVVGSTASLGGGADVAYAAAKAALNRWVVTLGSQVGREGMTANLIAAGFVPDTELYGGGLDPEWTAKITRGIAVGRAGTPEDVAVGVAWLVSPQASWTNASMIVIDGGSTLNR